MHDMTVTDEREFDLQREITRNAVELVQGWSEDKLGQACDIEAAMDCIFDDLYADVRAAVSACDPEDQLLGLRENVIDAVTDRIQAFLNRYETPVKVKQ